MARLGRMNEASLRATLVAKTAFERFWTESSWEDPWEKRGKTHGDWRFEWEKP